jgi:DNA-binding response OmpR family regulator
MTHATLRRVLETSGHEVEAVGTVAEAYARLGHSRCIVLDLRLPDGCGIDLLRYVRERHLPVRVAVNTGCADNKLLNEVRALRPDALFIKPFDPEMLLAWLRGVPA